MSATLITELQELLTVGINVDKYHLHLTVKLVAVICDAPARSNVKYIVGHNGIAGCDKCQVLGTRMGGRMTFPNGEHDLRSDVTFRCRSQSIHHRGRSSFENLPVDMIKCFPCEPMHMIYLGVTKKIVSLWKELALKRLNRMDQSIIASINDALDLCRQHTTCDFQRKCRSLNEVSVWKATECRLFLLYLGPVVLQNRLPLSMYRNFQSLSLSIYLLSHPKFHSIFANSVRVYINNFLLGYERCYGTEHLIYNVHSLKHIADDVMEHGTLESFAAFPFESYMRKIRRSVHCGFAVAKQAAQRYAEEVYFQSILNQDMADNVTEPEVTDNSSKQMVSYRNSKLSTSRPDNVVIAKGRPGFVTEIRDGGLIRFRPFHSPSDLYTDPFPSSSIGMFKCSTLSHECTWITLTDILCKCMCLRTQHYEVIIPLLHTF
ncbi:hypothetical protein MS3_00001695 [Schistosoma haematobium]|uniref:Uncharacterized protein n=1 Tax=Schistosoma haematobium TaxID=6185 RepID=A0A922LXL3_SCHHA|nr:hypothetical protein MS3_00001695 [Schistosoma haematobium]KAH9595763.1 hypothetical protein MS3_00001695 [Schistosoma haematobium]